MFENVNDLSLNRSILVSIKRHSHAVARRKRTQPVCDRLHYLVSFGACRRLFGQQQRGIARYVTCGDFRERKARLTAPPERLLN